MQAPLAAEGGRGGAAEEAALLDALLDACADAGAPERSSTPARPSARWRVGALPPCAAVCEVGEG